MTKNKSKQSLLCFFMFVQDKTSDILSRSHLEEVSKMLTVRLVGLLLVARLLGAEAEVDCFVDGLCEGEALGEVDSATSAGNCLRICQLEPSCGWISFNEASQLCILFKDCYSLDETCSDCTSASSDCEIDGYVAMIIGGNNETVYGTGYLKSIELYSPEGGCQYQLADFPIDGAYLYWPAVGFIDDKIVACGGNNVTKDCRLYDRFTDTWSVYSTGSFYHEYMPGTIYDGKIYLADITHPEIFDPVQVSWSTWPPAPVDVFSYPTLIPWQDSILYIGGYSNRLGIQVFNVTTSEWSLMEFNSEVPMELWASSCIKLNEEEILFLGSAAGEFYYRHSILNMTDKTWSLYGPNKYQRDATTLTKLGDRIFAIGGWQGTEVIEEFNYSDKTWSEVPHQLITRRFGHSSLVLPARLFSHLPNGCKGIV